MTSYELHINGVVCDLSSDADVTLVYQNGIFTTLDAIQSNRSFNIDLPLTPRNIEAVKFAQRPDADSNTPYIKLPASLYRGGVPIFIDGRAVITGISDVISVTLVWGNVDNFDPLFDSELSELSDTLESMGYGHIDWNENSYIVTAPSESSPTPSMGFFAVDFGMGYSNIKYMHPSIMVGRVLEAIERFHGITIDGKERLMNTHLLPCVTKKGSPKYNYGLYTKGFHLSYYSFPSAATGQDGTFWAETNSAGIVRDYAGIYSHDSDAARIRIDVSKVDSIRVQLINGRVSDGALEALGPKLQIRAGKSDVKYADYDVIYETYAYKYPINIDEEFDVSKYDNIAICVTKYRWQVAPSLGNLITGDFYVWGDFPDINLRMPSVFPIARNLPDMSHGEFIAALMALSGQFAYAAQDAPNTIKMISADDILDNMNHEDAVDWSAKVLLSDRRIIGMPEASEFSIEDYAQKNILDYDNDDDVETDTAGEILIPNVNLEKETELTDMSFSASDNSQTTNGRKVGLIPLYTKDEDYKESDSEEEKQKHVQYNELSPRILSWYQDYAPNSELTRWLYGYFPSNMQFGGEKGIVATKYAGLQRILQRLRIITVRARLSALDLYNLDYSKPVYIAQFGAFFAIYNITTGENEICECKLIQLPN